MSHLFYFVSAVSVILAIPLGIGIATLLTMKESIVIPLLRVRTAAGPNVPLRMERVAPTVDPEKTRHRVVLTIGTTP